MAHEVRSADDKTFDKLEKFEWLPRLYRPKGPSRERDAAECCKSSVRRGFFGLIYEAIRVEGTILGNFEDATELVGCALLEEVARKFVVAIMGI